MEHKISLRFVGRLAYLYANTAELTNKLAQLKANVSGERKIYTSVEEFMADRQMLIDLVVSRRQNLQVYNKKHLKNVGPIRHCEPPHAALPFPRCRYCGVARRLRIDVYNDDDDNA